MSTPILKIRAHIQIMAKTETRPMTIETTICHNATGSVEAVTLKIMTNGRRGGVKLVMVASRPLGCSASIGQSARGIIKISIIIIRIIMIIIIIIIFIIIII